MKSRWIIRSFFIGLLLLCVGGWVWSATHYGQLVYARNGYTMFSASTGAVGVVYMPGVVPNGGWTGESHASGGPPQFWPASGGRAFLGFSCGYQAPSGHVPASFYFLGFPFWFAVLVSSLGLFFVWRKTRPQVKGRAFPVEAGVADGGKMRP